MDSRFNSSLLIFTLIVSIFFSACSKDEDANSNTIEEVQLNLPVYVSEAEQGDYKNIYSYERVDGKICLKQIDLFKLGTKKYDFKFEYDNQNRLVECKRSVSTLDSKYHENKIFNNLVLIDCSITYSEDKVTVIDKDNTGITYIYKLGRDGFAKEITQNSQNGSIVMKLTRSGNDFIKSVRTYSFGDVISERTYVSIYDDMKSIDYLQVILPCLSSEHNILRIAQSENGHDVRRTTYAYTYRTSDFPVTILKNEITINGAEEESHRTTTTLKYINAENI